GRDAEVFKPRGQYQRVQMKSTGQFGNRSLVRGGLRLTRSAQASRDRRIDLVAFAIELADERANVTQGQIGPPGRHQSGVLPDDEIVFAAVSGIRRRKIERRVLLTVRRRQLDAKVLPRDER